MKFTLAATAAITGVPYVSCLVKISPVRFWLGGGLRSL